jgi:ubiquinone biosynthesis protein
MALLPMLRRLPRRMDRIAAAVEGGRLSVNVRLLADERDRQTINGWLQLGLYQFLGYCLLVICSLLALRVLAAVFRAPR